MSSINNNLKFKELLLELMEEVLQLDKPSCPCLDLISLKSILMKLIKRFENHGYKELNIPPGPNG